jgi:hypothetical protein
MAWQPRENCAEDSNQYFAKTYDALFGGWCAQILGGTYYMLIYSHPPLGADEVSG